MSATESHPAAPSAPPPALVVVGASVRGWAESVRRAGWVVRGVDLFADRDLLAMAEAVAIDPREYPEGLVDAASRFPPGPWCYSGALENRPDIVDAIAESRPLAGCPGRVLREVRSPTILARVLRQEAIPFPATRDDPHGLPLDGSWLVKPSHGAAGRGIAPWTGSTPPSRGRIWQERVPGRTVSASFVSDRGTARLVGSTEQLVGIGSWNASPFAWCGAVEIAPDVLPGPWRRQWERIGRVLAGRFALVGAIGVDAIAAADGTLVVLEVNPRPTASMELIDRRTGGALARDHLAACGFDAPPGPQAVPAEGFWAKGLLRARCELVVDERVDDAIERRQESWRDEDGQAALADLPRSGTVVPAGAPILTLFARGTGPEDARRRLAGRVADFATALPPCLVTAMH